MQDLRAKMIPKHAVRIHLERIVALGRRVLAG